MTSLNQKETTSEHEVLATGDFNQNKRDRRVCSKIKLLVALIAASFPLLSSASTNPVPTSGFSVELTSSNPALDAAVATTLAKYTATQATLATAIKNRDTTRAAYDAAVVVRDKTNADYSLLNGQLQSVTKDRNAVVFQLGAANLAINSLLSSSNHKATPEELAAARKAYYDIEAKYAPLQKQIDALTPKVNALYTIKYNASNVAGTANVNRMAAQATYADAYNANLISKADYDKALAALNAQLALDAKATSTTSGPILSAVGPLTAAQVTEQGKSAFLNKSKGTTAYAKGFRGKDVTVAVIDSGIYYSKEFAGRMPVEYDAVTNTVITDSTKFTIASNHGTNVAGIIGAAADGNGMVGVAPEATILPINVFTKNIAYDTNVSTAINYAVGKARIINMSLGGSGGMATSMTNAIKSGMLFVIACGNSASANCDYPARYASAPTMAGGILAVGAVDTTTGLLAAYSSKAGDAKNFYLLAPGTGYSTTMGSSPTYPVYATMMGTSQATPVVSGAAALLMSAWPKLSAYQTGQILLNTATDMGDSGVDAIYGHGLLNIEAALNPVGIPTTALSTGGTVKTSSITINTGSATGSATAKSLSGVRVLSVDDYGRDFYASASNMVAKPTSTMSLDSIFNVVDIYTRTASIENKNLTAMLVSKDPGQSRLGLLEEARDSGNLVSSMVTFKLNGGQELSYGTGGFATKYFGLAETKGLPLYGRDAFSNPYLGLVQSNRYTGGAASLTDHTKIRVGLVQNGKYASTGPISGFAMDTPSARSSLMEIEHKFSDATMLVSFGNTKEASTFLSGTSSAGAGFTNTATKFTSFAFAKPLSDQFTALATYSAGETAGVGYGLTEDARTRTRSYSVGLVGRSLVSKGDTLTLAMSSPLVATRGTMTLNVPTAQDDAGNPVFERVSASMAPSARERDLEMGYNFVTKKNASVSLMGMLRFNPGHESGVSSEKIVGVRYSTVF